MTEEQGTTQVTASPAHNNENPINRETLYERVWSEPMLKVAARFGVSSSYMARVCTLVSSTDALERFDAWRASEER